MQRRQPAARKDSMDKAHIKEGLLHETKEFFMVFLFLAPLLTSLATYRMYVTGDWGRAFFAYGMAIVNALVLAKIVLIGEIARLGRMSEKQPLIGSQSLRVYAAHSSV